MTAADQRRALERLSQSYRKLLAGAKPPPPPEQGERPAPTPEAPALPPPASPGSTAAPQG